MARILVVLGSRTNSFAVCSRGLLRKGQNEIVIFETEGRFSEVIDFVKEPMKKVRKGEWMMAIVE